MPKVSAENPKLFKFKKQNQATNCSSGHVERIFVNFLKFFGQKSEKNFRSKSEKILKRRIKKLILRNFYSGHVDRILRTMPKVSAENPKRFKTFKKISSQKLFLWTRRRLFWKLLEVFFGQKSENFFSQNPKKL